MIVVRNNLGFNTDDNLKQLLENGVIDSYSKINKKKLYNLGIYKRIYKKNPFDYRVIKEDKTFLIQIMDFNNILVLLEFPSSNGNSDDGIMKHGGNLNAVYCDSYYIDEAIETLSSLVEW